MTKFVCVKDYESTFQNFTKGKEYIGRELQNGPLDGKYFIVQDDNGKDVNFCLGSLLNLNHLHILTGCDACIERKCNSCEIRSNKL